MHADSPTPTDGRPRVALAAVAAGWAEDDDAPLLLDALGAVGVDAEPAMWDDRGVDWSEFDLVVIRSTWDYAERHEEFAAWADRVGRSTTLANPASVVRWNLDKHYLHDLARHGIPVVPTRFVEPGATDAQIQAALADRDDGTEVVVKPAVSAGSKDTVRHSAANLAAASAHVRSLVDEGRSAMVQPYLDAVDEQGETGMVFFAGRFSHAFRKGPLLAPDGAPPEGLFAPEQITARGADPDQLRLAEQVLAAARDEVGEALLYARVDVLRDAGGDPRLLELELVEPSFFLATDPDASGRVAQAILDAARAAREVRRRH